MMRQLEPFLQVQTKLAWETKRPDMISTPMVQLMFTLAQHPLKDLKKIGCKRFQAMAGSAISGYLGPLSHISTQARSTGLRHLSAAAKAIAGERQRAGRGARRARRG